jgi:transposase-like protein
LDVKVSASAVSRITRRLDSKVRQFHKAPILDEYQYLILDGITLKIRYGAKYHRRKVLVAYGITVFGQRKLIGFVQAKGESQDAWEGLLNSLRDRGLLGEHLLMIVMDGSAGLKAASQMVYPHAKIQRCWAHKLRNVASYSRKKYQEELIAAAQRIYLSQNRSRAVGEFKSWKKAWQRTCPAAVHCLEKDLEELLNFLDCPKSHQIKVRTTNAIERAFREVRRRTRVFTCFSNRDSCERIIYAIFTHLNNNWTGKPLKQFTQFN